jgi:hypothetical protein
MPTSHCNAQLSLWCPPLIVMPNSHCDAHLTLWCPPHIVMPNSHCDAHLTLWCPPLIVMPNSHCDAHLTYWYPPHIPFLRICAYFTLFLAHHSFLPTSSGHETPFWVCDQRICHRQYKRFLLTSPLGWQQSTSCRPTDPRTRAFQRKMKSGMWAGAVNAERWLAASVCGSVVPAHWIIRISYKKINKRPPHLSLSYVYIFITVDKIT